MAKKSSRTPTGLNLTPELPEVVSRDFNLFYTPQQEPEIAGLKEFTSALDNFVNNGGTKAVLASEAEDKKINSAKAQQDYVQNKLAFREAIKAGQIDATANPYYLEKYKELTLNSFASEFSLKLNKAYQDQKVVDNILPNSFDNFYKNELGKFIKEKELGAFNPLDLDKGFFKETSAFRNQFENNHRSSQLAVFKQKFNDRVSARIGAVIDQFKNLDENEFTENNAGYNKYNLMGDSINVLIGELIDVNGDGRETIDIVFEGIKNWATSTSDYELAKKIVSELPSKLLAGTDTIENIGRIKLEKDRLFDALVDKSEERTKKFNSLTKNRREQDQLNTYSYLAEQRKNNPNFDVDAWASKQNLTGSQRIGIADFQKDQLYERGNTDNPATLKRLDDLINNQRNYLKAYEFARDQYQKGNLRLETKDKYIGQYITDAQSGKYDEALQNKFIREDLQRISKIISSDKGGDSAIEAVEFTNYVTYTLRNWHKYNSSNFKNQYEYDKALEAEYSAIIKNVKSLNKYSSLFGKFDDSFRFGSGTTNENINKAIEDKRKADELAKQIERQNNKNLTDDEFQKIYDLKQKEKNIINLSKEERDKLTKIKEKEEFRKGRKQFDESKKRPFIERIKEDFSFNMKIPNTPDK